MKNANTKTITTTALMAALVFVGTFFFKIPSPFGGYAHLGDCMIILAVCLLGTYRGAIAGAIGAGLSDLFGGYVVWVLPTAVIKGVWALLMGLFMYHLLKKFRFGWLVGAIVGGIAQIILYTLVKIPLYGAPGAFAEVPLLTGQTICGIVLGGVIYAILSRNAVWGKLRTMCQNKNFQESAE